MDYVQLRKWEDSLRGLIGLRHSNTFYPFLVLKTRVICWETCFGNHSKIAFLLIDSYRFLSSASHCQICISRLYACARSLSLLHIWCCCNSCILAMPSSLWQLMEKKGNPKTGFWLVPALEFGTEYSLLLFVFIQSFRISSGERKGGRCNIGVWD